MYSAIGNFEKATHHADIALSINPLSPSHLYTQGNIHYLTKNYEAAVETMNAILDIDPNWSLAGEIIAACGVLMNNPEKLTAFLNSTSQVKKPKDCKLFFRFLNRDIAVDLAEERSLEEIQLQDGATISLIPWHLYLQVYKGNHDIALDILEKGVQYRIGQFINFRHDPFLAPLHEYDRFQQLVEVIFDESKLPLEELEFEELESNPLLNNNETDQYLVGLTSLLENEKLYLNTDLSLKSLAEHIAIHPNKLSWLLNKHIGKNFNDYINTYRVEDFKTKAQDPVHKHLTLLGLAFESGFNSKSVFNAFFKKMEGISPSVWLKSVQA